MNISGVFKDKLLSILRAAVLDILRFLAYFLAVSFFICLIFNNVANFKTIILQSLFFETVDLPLGSFATTLGCSLLFIIVTVFAGAVAAVRDFNHFKTSILIRLSFFTMNMLPIVLTWHILIEELTGFQIVFFIPLYFLIIFGIDKLSERLRLKKKDGAKPLVFSGRLLFESIALAITILAFVLWTVLKNAGMETRHFNPTTFTQWFMYFLFIVFFNSVSFFTIEYCIDIFKSEYKKNYSRYHSIYNRNIFIRAWNVLRNALGETLGKIKNTIAWLVMFVIPIETIMENKATIGSYLLDSYGTSGDMLGLVRNIKYLLVIMFIIEIMIDILSRIFGKAKDVTAMSPNFPKTDQKQLIKIKTPATHRLKYIFAITAVLVIYMVSLHFCNREYAWAGYYDFESNKTINELLEEIEYQPDNNALLNTRLPLVSKSNDNKSYQVAQINILRNNGIIENMAPYYDDNDYKFIINNRNYYQGKAIASGDTIIDIVTAEKYRNAPFSNTMTKFRLQTDTDKTFVSEKPLGIIIPFYILYLLTIVIIVCIVTFLAYKGITIFHFWKRGVLKTIIHYAALFFREVLKFLNSLTIIIVFLLVNLFLQKLGDAAIEKGEFTDWRNMPFVASLVSYCLMQTLIMVMFCITFAGEIGKQLLNFTNSKECEYYNLIGMGGRNLCYIYDRKYGKNLFYKLVFQNILFVFNINWFICYVFNNRSRFFDTIGITYSISFENIFTKIILNSPKNAGLYNYIILLCINILLFSAYIINKKKMNGD